MCIRSCFRCGEQVREGVIEEKGAVLDVRRVAESRRLPEIESRYKLLREEHELLKQSDLRERDLPTARAMDQPRAESPRAGDCERWAACRKG